MSEPSPLSHLPISAAQHFRLYCYGAVLHLIESLARSVQSSEKVFEQFPFLLPYAQELSLSAQLEQEPNDLLAWWFESLCAWEKNGDESLSLRALSLATGLDPVALTVFFSLGLAEEDPRFGSICEWFGGPGQRRWTQVALANCWSSFCDARPILHHLQRCGMVTKSAGSDIFGDSTLQVSPILWEALRGCDELALPAWASLSDWQRAPSLDDLILPQDLKDTVARLPSIFADGRTRSMMVRGLHHNGRRTLVRALAASAKQGVLFVSTENASVDEHLRQVGCVATALNLMLAVVIDSSGGECIELQETPGYSGPVAIVLGRQSTVAGDLVEKAVLLEVPPPAQELRRHLWTDALEGITSCDLEQFSEVFHLTSGNIYRAAPLAISHARLDDREEVTAADVREACRGLITHGLEHLATRLDTIGDWSSLAVAGETMQELYGLEERCRHRERLCEYVGAPLASQMNCGVRALFKGCSGTGKSLAARLLAGALHMDLYRIDLAFVVNKYIGETEKNLEQIFSRAEELNILLLLDEGDALLTQRTGVQTSNDRYANLETNYLLQRMESFTGILLVTTNAVDRIDSAFQRRMDVVIDFRPPDASERWAIWQLHLPASHLVDPTLLSEVAGRCEFTGGQIRNAVLHATLLALSNGGRVTSSHLSEAVQREYRKSGAACPLRRLALNSNA